MNFKPLPFSHSLYEGITNIIWCSMSSNGANKMVLMQLLKCLDYMQYLWGSKAKAKKRENIWTKSKQTEKLPKHHRHVVNGSCPNKWFILIHLGFRRYFFAVEFTSISFGTVGWCLLWQYIFHNISFWLEKIPINSWPNQTIANFEWKVDKFMCTTRYS